MNTLLALIVFCGVVEVSLSSSILTPLGRIKGIECSAYNDVVQFLGVPFAEAPLGALRYRPPVMYATTYPETGYDATEPPPPCGSICSLTSTPANDVATTIEASEDCLYLNIWTPKNVTVNSMLPVRVYIHGGAVNLCSASDTHLIGCDAVKKTGMIQVNIQFRRGPFGFLAHPLTLNESQTTGNWAFLDQQLALKWVQKNIKYFGGDKSKVMLNGQSGGAQCVDMHQVAPGSAGLFSSAISQSPPCVKFISLEKAYNFSIRFMETVGCYPLSDLSEQLKCMRSLPWNTLMNASRTYANNNFAKLLLCEGADWVSFFHYTLDNSVFTTQVEEALIQGNFHKVPYLVGSNTDEGTYFEEDIIDDFEQDAMASRFSVLQVLYPHANLTEFLSFYTEALFPGDKNDTDLILAHMWTDIFYTCPIHKRLVARAKSDPRNMYLYNWNVTMGCPPETEYLGSTHTAELRASFGITDNIASSLAPGGFCNYTKEERVFSNVLLYAWKSMANEGVPRWENGRPWPLWEDQTEYGVFFSRNNTFVGKLNPGLRCLLIEEALHVTKETAKEMATTPPPPAPLSPPPASIESNFVGDTFRALSASRLS